MRILYLTDSKEESSQIKLWYEWAAVQVGAKQYRRKHIPFVFKHIPTADLLREIEASDVILFDYGMLATPLGECGLVDYWNRFFIQTIEDLPGKRWFAVSALDTFYPEDKDRLKALGVEFYWDTH